MNNPVLILILATMYAGKTTFLLNKATKLLELNQKIIYINSNIDDRTDEQYSSHNPILENKYIENIKMVKVKNLYDVLNLVDLDEYDTIMIDESQFFTDLVPFVKEYNYKNMYVAGLKSDSNGNKFGDTIDLIVDSTKYIELFAYCKCCADNGTKTKAIYTKKIVESNSLIESGAKDKYIPVCKFHFKEPKKTSSKIELVKLDDTNYSYYGI